MPFEEALAALRAGQRLGRFRGAARREWRNVLILNGHGLQLQWPSGTRSMWAPTQDDLLTEDWEIRV